MQTNSVSSRTVDELSLPRIVLAFLLFEVLFAFAFCIGAAAMPSPFAGLLMLAGILSQIMALFTLIRGVRSRRQRKEKPAKEPEPAVGKKPAVPRRKSMPVAYREQLKTLLSMYNDMSSRASTIESFLSDYFENSLLSISRYQTVMKQALQTLLDNYHKALQAVQMFGTAVTPDRMRILDGYVDDSREIVRKMESIIDEMTKLQQARLFDDSQPVDDMLEELSDTTHRYAKQ